ncbi:efflux RND transporter periplasmic adaptor subunit [Sporomusa sp.]|uniref:efflux RND transporter periplasmic adaptor subunit n=1 Tax=Sporomusa sp. TaxID=2078658 RepID=UPI002C50446C|nr:efflux RND transporter periplasmic adaptor subunit [Sporomusa sp.]HWR45678.1 efflux RND transporter periplasmic adaptor subunit [Sporomusa sp.]
MKKFPQKYCIIVALTALLFTVALLLATSYNLLPVSLWTQYSKPRMPVNITAVPLGTINKPIHIVRTGSIENSTSVPINAEFSGQLSEIYVTEGQAVKAGQPLLKLQASSEPTVNQTIGASQQTQANYDKALEEFNRYQKLFEIGGIPRRQLDLAITHLQEAKASLNNTPNTMQSSNATINGSATINAPINGIVTGLSTAPGKTVQAGQQLISLGSGQAVEVVVHLDQNDLYLAHLGTPAAIEVSQQTIVGQISGIYPQVEANQISSFLAHIKLTNNPAGLLKSGMSVNVRIDTGTSVIVPAVPSASIFQDDKGKNFIYTTTTGKAIIQQISIGETIGEFTEITSLLPQQSMVITSNPKDIKDGDTITVIQ